MVKSDARKILRMRMLEYHGYKNKEIRKSNLKKQITGNLFSLMPVIVMSIFVIAAFVVGLTYLKYTGPMSADGSGMKPTTLSKLVDQLQMDKQFKAAVKNTFIYTGVVVSFSLVWSLILASIINLSKLRGRKLFMVGFFLPQITSDIAATIIFTAMMKNSLGVDTDPQNWFWIVAIVGMWSLTASSFVIFNTAFANIGKTEYEAASLDGAGTFTKFFKITLPALAPIIAYQLMMSIVVAMTSFGASYSLISMHYVSGTNKDFVLLWPVIGFLRAKGGAEVGITPNVGLGMLELLILGGVLIALTLISNLIQPIQGRK